MVDLKTYRQMHQKEKSKHFTRLRDELGKTVMDQKEPPSGNFLLLLPSEVYGFNLEQKTWSKSPHPLPAHLLLKSIH